MIPAATALLGLPNGTRRIDQVLARGNTHDIKDAIREAGHCGGPTDWVWISPDGRVIVTGEGGRTEDIRHWQAWDTRLSNPGRTPRT